MENEDTIVQVRLWVSNLAKNTESTNTIQIYLDKVIEEVAEDESGMVTQLSSYRFPLEINSRIRLHPHNLTPSHLSELLHDQQVPRHQSLGQQISCGIIRVLTQDVSLRQPVFVSVNVKFIEVTRYLLPPAVSVPRGAPEDVFQRLVEEQRVESSTGEDETCSICIENLSKNIVEMPHCLHMFHQDCLFEWLGRYNSCPLCRKVPYEEDDTQITIFN